MRETPFLGPDRLHPRRRYEMSVCDRPKVTLRPPIQSGRECGLLMDDLCRRPARGPVAKLALRSRNLASLSFLSTAALYAALKRSIALSIAAKPAGVTRFGRLDIGRSGRSTDSSSACLTNARLILAFSGLSKTLYLRKMPLKALIKRSHV
jgi:hypothetical protein